jgi:uncharacterized coiled-coil DUF342 family protein
MGLGSTTKKIQTIADKAEQVYAQVDELREQLTELRAKVDTTHDTVTELKVRHEQNRALLEALAEEQGIDVEQVLTEAAIDDVDARTSEETHGGSETSAGTGADRSAEQTDQSGPSESTAATGAEPADPGPTEGDAS